MAGLYVHFPFCASKCIYCDFYARVRRDWKAYGEALLRELEDRTAEWKGVPPTTLYFGGGTPSLLPPALLREVAAACRTAFGVRDFAEFTVEVNPDDVTPAFADALRAMGVNRVSVGVQSFRDDQLYWMRRRHTAAQAEEAFATLRGAGCDNLSLDLIFGFEGLDDADWSYSVDRALALHPAHISCYQMMGRWADGDENRCRRQYTLLQDKLLAAGYEQYEISNYALPGHASRHNSAYWSREPYLGLGAGAHSFDGDRLRRWNTPDIDAYVASRPYGTERLSDREVLEEKLMLGLRTVRGLDLGVLTPDERALLAQKEPVLERLSKTGQICIDDSFWRIPAGELFVSDSIIRELFPD